MVFDEAQVNSRTRIPFEKALATELQRAGPDAVIMINTNDHIGAVQDAGIDLKRLVSPLDSQTFDVAKAAPAEHANLVVTFQWPPTNSDRDAGRDPDPVAEAVRAHPEGLSEIEILRHTGQPCARLYRSTSYKGQP